MGQSLAPQLLLFRIRVFQPSEFERVRESFLMTKHALSLSDVKLDQAIAELCGKMSRAATKLLPIVFNPKAIDVCTVAIA